jgi:hypothetical protein
MDHIERIKERRAKRLKQDEERQERSEWSDEKYSQWALEQTIKKLREPLAKVYKEEVIDEEVIFSFSFADPCRSELLVKYTPGEYSKGYTINEPGNINLYIISPRYNYLGAEWANWLRMLLREIVPDPKSLEINTVKDADGNERCYEYIDRIIKTQGNYPYI